MELVRKVKSKTGLVYSSIPKSQIIVFKKTKTHVMSLYNYYDQIKDQRKDNGKYMIKRFNLKHMQGRYFDLITHNKTYFCYADKGICFTSKRNKKQEIFYLNNRVTAIKLVKELIKNHHYAYDELYSIVNRETGETKYIVPDTWYNSKLKRNDMVYIK